jgi:hypothetical protein
VDVIWRVQFVGLLALWLCRYPNESTTIFEAKHTFCGMMSKLFKFKSLTPTYCLLWGTLTWILFLPLIIIYIMIYTCYGLMHPWSSTLSTQKGLGWYPETPECPRGKRKTSTLGPVPIITSNTVTYLLDSTNSNPSHRESYQQNIRYGYLYPNNLLSYICTHSTATGSAGQLEVLQHSHWKFWTHLGSSTVIFCLSICNTYASCPSR